MVDILDRINASLDRMRDGGREPARLLIGHREAAEMEVALRRFLYPPRPDCDPLLPYPLTERATWCDVPIERVDQESLIGVIAEGAD